MFFNQPAAAKMPRQPTASSTHPVPHTTQQAVNASWRTVPRVEVRPQAADGPLHALAAVKVGRVLLNGHVGEVDVCVADVLLLHAEAAVGEARKAAPARQTAQVHAQLVAAGDQRPPAAMVSAINSAMPDQARNHTPVQVHAQRVVAGDQRVPAAMVPV